MGLRFEWDEQNSRQNQRKHGVSFEEAQTVFYDERPLLIPDPDASDDEHRFVLLGLSSEARMLVVCHCHRETDLVIRSISARKATKKERAAYFRKGRR